MLAFVSRYLPDKQVNNRFTEAGKGFSPISPVGNETAEPTDATETKAI